MGCRHASSGPCCCPRCTQVFTKAIKNAKINLYLWPHLQFSLYPIQNIFALVLSPLPARNISLTVYFRRDRRRTMDRLGGDRVISFAVGMSSSSPLKLLPVSCCATTPSITAWLGSDCNSTRANGT